MAVAFPQGPNLSRVAALQLLVTLVPATHRYRVPGGGGAGGGSGGGGFGGGLGGYSGGGKGGGIGGSTARTPVILF